MNRQSKSFCLSATIHLVVLMLLGVLATDTYTRKAPVVIDLSVTNREDSSPGIQGGPQHVLQPVVSRKTSAIKQNRPKIVQTFSNEKLQAPIVQEQTIRQVESGITESATASGPSTAGSQHRGNGQDPGLPGSGRSSGSSTGIPDGEQAKIVYLKEHFARIRETIMKKISYPLIARKMGWTGTAKVSFIICEDGRAKNIRILAGSGFDLLDRNAVETVRACSPYPRPPVTAEVIMPITYRLESHEE